MKKGGPILPLIDPPPSVAEVTETEKERARA